VRRQGMVTERVVFLTRVVEKGAADRSYGIHVAKLAGLTRRTGRVKDDRGWRCWRRWEKERDKGEVGRSSESEVMSRIVR